MNMHPMGHLEMFSAEDQAIQAEIHQRLLRLPDDLAPVGIVCLFDYFQRFGVRYNGVTTIEAFETLGSECREVDRVVLATLRTGDLDAIRCMVQGGSFLTGIGGGTPILVGCEPPPTSGSASFGKAA